MKMPGGTGWTAGSVVPGLGIPDDAEKPFSCVCFFVLRGTRHISARLVGSLSAAVVRPLVVFRIDLRFRFAVCATCSAPGRRHRLLPARPVNEIRWPVCDRNVYDR